jgi:hypothetical protein
MTSCFRHCVRFSHFWVVTKCWLVWRYQQASHNIHN